MGAPEAIRLGPFIGGLNTASDPTSVQDIDLVICENLELDLDGALVNRPPIVDTGVNFPVSTGSIKLLGHYTSTTGTHYLLGSNGVTSTYYFNGAAWVQITNTVSAHAFCQYKDKAWFIAKSGSTQTGGSWDPAAGFAAVPNIPKGSSIVVNKERLWIAGGKEATADGARITYSAVGEPNKWPDTSPSGGGYLNVNGGDGQNAIRLETYFSDVVIFKEHSCYRFTFNTDPGGGTLLRLSDTVGIAGPNCLVVYESSFYVLYEDKIYLLSNYNFTRTNIKVPLVANSPSFTLSEPFNLSVWADRLIVGYHDTTYVLSLRTNTWCTWSSATVGPIGRVIEEIVAQGVPTSAYTYSTTLGAPKLYKISLEVGSVGEVMTCSMRTKNYDYQSSHTFKKLAQWGADIVARSNITGIVTPIVYSLPVTWGQMKARTWGGGEAGG